MLKRIINPEISMLGGIAAGLAYKLGIPLWSSRIGFIVLGLIFNVLTPFIYILGWIFLPKLFVSERDFVLKTKHKNQVTSPFDETPFAKKQDIQDAKIIEEKEFNK